MANYVSNEVNLIFKKLETLTNPQLLNNTKLDNVSIPIDEQKTSYQYNKLVSQNTKLNKFNGIDISKKKDIDNADIDKLISKYNN
jgi:hypothetical protein